MTDLTAPPDKFRTKKTWVQTERKAHEEWAALIRRKPMAATVLHHLVANMEDGNAVAVGQKVLAEMIGVHERTIRRALADLAAESWIEIVRMNGPGTVAAYIINDRVAWGEKRENLRFSRFSATIIASAADQPAEALEDRRPLRTLPPLRHDEIQLPAGDGAGPPSQALLPGTEPDLPTRAAPPAVDSLGRDRIDRQTGEYITDDRIAAELDDLAITGRAAVENTIRRQQQELAELLASIKAPPLPPR